ncbi:lactate dehydrogenase [Vibrio sp. SCSIO 43136]|uniref:lactate dehydrogenase n=1 Tax=Vibrio sp. SCSIO 43136 TaxID=2819101 RepID=UPI002075BFDE|nr:lactate dehydrogenase [Vibrio sp. SCSIO 43136]USD67912.1 IS1 family transposase [Vibrio sp. SCSIO 43136]
MSYDQLPKDAEGLQLNFCKTLACDNFGLSDAKHYVLQHANPKRPAMVCRECGAFPPLLNNQEVVNELTRLRHVHSDGLPACRNPECDSFGKTVHTHKHLYHSFGFSGDRQRYRCKVCQSTFVDKWSGSNAKITLQEVLLGYLFTGYSVREICRKLSINPKTFYDHVDQIASRCRRKLAMFDARWLKHADSFTLASQYTPLQPKSNNGVFWFVTCDANSGYVHSQHVNYSFDEEPQGTELHNPYEFPARFVSSEYSPEGAALPSTNSDNLRQKIDHKYQQILARGNVEDPMGNLAAFNHPSKGALIRPPYTSYAHYLNILNSCGEDKPVILYMPQDPVLRSAALSIYRKPIQNKTADLIYVEEDSQWDAAYTDQKIDIVHVGWWRDRWAIKSHQKASKGICHLAGERNDSEYWLKHATTNQPEFYQQRFHVLFESFVNEPRRKLRPGGLLPLLDIFRAWHNLCYQHKDGLTPAQQMGLSDKPLTLKALLS